MFFGDYRCEHLLAAFNFFRLPLTRFENGFMDATMGLFLLIES